MLCALAVNIQILNQLTRENSAVAFEVYDGLPVHTTKGAMRQVYSCGV